MPDPENRQLLCKAYVARSLKQKREQERLDHKRRLEEEDLERQLYYLGFLGVFVVACFGGCATCCAKERNNRRANENSGGNVILAEEAARGPGAHKMTTAFTDNELPNRYRPEGATG